MDVAAQQLFKSNLTRDDFETHLRYSKKLYESIEKKDTKAARKTMMEIFDHLLEIYQFDD